MFIFEQSLTTCIFLQWRINKGLVVKCVLIELGLIFRAMIERNLKKNLLNIKQTLELDLHNFSIGPYMNAQILGYVPIDAYFCLKYCCMPLLKSSRQLEQENCLCVSS